MSRLLLIGWCVLMLSWELQRHGEKCYVLYAPSKAKVKNFFAACAGWATAFKCMGRHIWSLGGLERDPEGRKRPVMDSLNQSSLISRRQVDLTDTAWMLGPLGDCFLPKESSFLPPCFYCCSCDVMWIFLNVYAQQDVLLLLRGSPREGAPSFCCFYFHHHYCRKFEKHRSRFEFEFDFLSRAPVNM